YIALDENNGAQLWTLAKSNLYNSLVRYNNLVIASNGSQVYGLNILTGEVAWQTPLDLPPGYSDPFVSHDTVFVGQYNFSPTYNATPPDSLVLVAFRAGTGELLWKKKPSRASANGYLVVAGGK